jgi:hypothetical protein
MSGDHVRPLRFVVSAGHFGQKNNEDTEGFDRRASIAAGHRNIVVAQRMIPPVPVGFARVTVERMPVLSTPLDPPPCKLMKTCKS